ncbi:MAG: hypothetical protein Q8P05_05745 [Candidatus Diapherotrites archaeon]|nr:hypothetical protein [Candidatus Diapherotrites archaeon]MDZ4256835.1 hypothetical protein [archaeon]
MATKKRTKKKAPRPAGKQIRKQLRSVGENVTASRRNATKEMKGVRKGLSKSLAKSTKRLSNQNKAIQDELAKLHSDLKKLQGKRPSRELSMYNLFVRQQIQKGKSFEEATKAWAKTKPVLEGKSPAPQKRKRTKTRKTVAPRVAAQKKISKRPRVNQKVASSLQDIMREVSHLKQDVNTLEQEERLIPKTKKGDGFSSSALSAEEVAVRLTNLYFEEIARLGFKRRLDFDAIINAYYYCLQRLQNKDKELHLMRRLVEKEEAKLSHETKQEMFPGAEE